MLGSRRDLLQGTLDLLILRTLQPGPMHGWAIAQVIRRRSRDVLQVNQGSLYPALHRLEDRGWIESAWGTTDDNRRAKFYHLSRKGRRELTRERASWRLFAGAVDEVLGAT